MIACKSLSVCISWRVPSRIWRARASGRPRARLDPRPRLPPLVDSSRPCAISPLGWLTRFATLSGVGCAPRARLSHRRLPCRVRAPRSVGGDSSHTRQEVQCGHDESASREHAPPHSTGGMTHADIEHAALRSHSLCRWCASLRRCSEATACRASLLPALCRWCSHRRLFFVRLM
jgi:hypothetical protein